jgi:dimethylamine/trimethylamine dehydrogenase
VAREPRYDILFEPVRIGPKVLRNRFYQVPHCTGFGTDKPAAQARFRSMKAEGGWAAVCTELCSIHPETDRAPRPVARLWDDDDARNLALMCEEAHEHGALAGVELWHGGPSSEGSGSREIPGAPSQIPSDLNPLSYPRTLDTAGIRELERQYAAAARRAVAAGFDIVYVYGAHSFLPLQFLSRYYNKRTDEYGGTLEHRARFWLETLELVRDAVGDSCAIAVRLAVDARGPHGIELEEGLEFVRLADHLVDLWDVNIGSITDRSADIAPARCEEEAWQLLWTGRVREATAKPIVGVGRLTSPERMVEIVESGVWDLIGAARPSISDPFLPLKIEEGRLDDIRECIGCNICLARALDHHQIACTQNPTAGEEYRRGWHPELFEPAGNREADVVVVGAGPAGLECALVLGKRGMRSVRLVEAEAEPGGIMRWVTKLPGLHDWARLVDHRTTQIDKLANVELVTATRLDATAVYGMGARIAIVATGARWAADGLNHLTHGPIPGAHRAHVLTPERVVAGEVPAGGRVLVYDCEGYFVGVGIAELLAERGHHIHYATPLPLVAPFLDHTEEGIPVRQRLADLEVETAVETELVSIGADDCVLRSFGRERTVEAQAVVLVTARVSDDALYRALRHDPGPFEAVYAIGDCVAPRLIADCVFDGHRLAREIDSIDPRRPLPYLRERRLLATSPQALQPSH